VEELFRLDKGCTWVARDLRCEHDFRPCMISCIGMGVGIPGSGFLFFLHGRRIGSNRF
jgi:hypothetical protein